MATDDTRARILSAAGPIFALKGFRDATVREICEAAGVGLASVNYHFQDKQQLYVRVVEHAYDYLQRSKPPRLDDVPPMPAEQRLREWLHRLARKVLAEQQQSWHERLLSREFRDPTPACEDFLRQRLNADLAPLLDTLRDVLPATTSAAERWHLAYLVLGQVLFYDTYRGFIRVLGGGAADPATFAPEQVADRIARFTAAALGLRTTLLVLPPGENP